jgi:hypothetical protein
MADFCLVARRTLDRPLERDVFALHFVAGLDWRACCSRLGVDRGLFFHAVYRIEHTLGRVFAELQPHALFPVAEYFAGSVRHAAAA